MKIRRSIQKGMTLIELTVVLLILVALAGLAIPYVGGTNRMAYCEATDASMQAIKTAIMGGGVNSGFYTDLLGKYPRNKFNVDEYNLRLLYEIGGWRAYNPKTAVGWRGPYLMSGSKIPSGLNDSFKDVYNHSTASDKVVHVDMTADNGSHPIDAWGRPIIIQVPYDSSGVANLDYARLVSAGAGSGISPSDASIDTKIEYSTTFPDAADRGDDRVLYLKMPDPLVGGNQPCNQ